MANPDYATLLALYAAETNPVLKQQLKEQIEVIEEELTQEEIELFDYVEPGYIEGNPKYDANGVFVSYVGIYIDEDGNYSGIYP